MIPKAKYLENLSFVFLAIRNPLMIIIRNKLTTITTPINPNSSLIIEKIKSVWGSGR